MLKIRLWSIAIMVAAMLSIVGSACVDRDAQLKSEYITPEATPPPPPRVVIVSEATFYGYGTTTRLDILCDTQTGNLIYSLTGQDRGSIQVVEGGCDAAQSK